jgi:hypothetical protein
MPVSSIITPKDYENYLVYLYFGSGKDLLAGCIQRAYRDFNRTLHGIGDFSHADEVKNKAVSLLTESLRKLQLAPEEQVSSLVFDQWHRTTCDDLCSLYENAGFYLYIGQAQKWVNMTLKYIFSVGEERISGFGFVYPFCHVPFDSILLSRLERFGFPLIDCAWSRLDDYSEYMSRQKWIRQHFTIAPLDVEFLLWLDKEIPLEYIANS